MKQIDLKFISWFVGFSEGDGSIFRRQNSPNLTLEISQHIKDSQVLYYIQSNLGFGRVYFPKNRPNIATYTITHQNELSIILNLLLPHVHTQQFLSYLDPMSLINTPPMGGPTPPPKLTLQDGWLAGFIDAEGCFRIKFESNNTVKLIFELSQKELIVLEQIKVLFPSLKDNIRQDRENWVLSFSQLQARNDLIRYLTIHPLKSHKNVVFTKWVKASRIIETAKVQGNLTIQGKASLEKLSKGLNTWRSPKGEVSPIEGGGSIRDPIND